MNKKDIEEFIDDIEIDLNSMKQNLSDINFDNLNDIEIESSYTSFLKKLASDIPVVNDKKEDTDGFTYYCKDDAPSEIQKKDKEPNIINGD